MIHHEHIELTSIIETWLEQDDVDGSENEKVFHRRDDVAGCAGSSGSIDAVIATMEMSIIGIETVGRIAQIARATTEARSLITLSKIKRPS